MFSFFHPHSFVFRLSLSLRQCSQSCDCHRRNVTFGVRNMPNTYQSNNECCAKLNAKIIIIQRSFDQVNIVHRSNAMMISKLLHVRIEFHWTKRTTTIFMFCFRRKQKKKQIRRKISLGQPTNESVFGQQPAHAHITHTKAITASQQMRIDREHKEDDSIDGNVKNVPNKSFSFVIYCSVPFGRNEIEVVCSVDRHLSDAGGAGRLIC